MNELTKNLMCVQMRSGVEIWLEQEKAKNLQKKLQGIIQSKFIYHEESNQTINTADVVGVFSANTMSEHTRRKNGAWKCLYGEWHDRNQKCGCKGERQIETCDTCQVAPCACLK